MRRMADPDEIAEFLIGVVRTSGAKMADRLKAAEIIYDRLEGKPVTTAVMNVRTSPALPPGWEVMGAAERAAFLDRLELGLPPAPVLALPEPDGES